MKASVTKKTAEMLAVSSNHEEEVAVSAKNKKSACQSKTGNLTPLSPATESQLGGIIVGSGLVIAENGRLSADIATEAEEDNSKPITSGAVYMEIGNISALLSII